MQEDFHYYATYCASYLAGYSHKECLDICYSAQFTDCCTETLLKKLNAPALASTTQSQIELLNTHTDIFGIQKITKIWSAFHFLPKDLYAIKKGRPLIYMNKYRLICGPNGKLVEDTVKLAKGKGTQAAGIAMHVLADTWAHSNFAGTPARVLNNTNKYFYESVLENGSWVDKKIVFKHNPATPDDVVEGNYNGSISQDNENSIMNLGHGRAGHFPDYSFAVYKYMPAWGDYDVITKDNPSDYFKAFSQMVYALKYLNGKVDDFELDKYDTQSVEPWSDEIKSIINKRQINANDDWKAFGERLSKETIPDFSISTYQSEYMDAPEKSKEEAFLGHYFKHAISHKYMVAGQVFLSGNLLSGFPVGYKTNILEFFRKIYNGKAVKG